MDWIVFLFACCGLVVSLHGSECRRYSTYLEHDSLGFCAGVFEEDYEYFVESSATTQADLERLAVAKLLGNSNTKIAMLSLLGARCNSALKKLVCTTVFPQCSHIDPYFVNPCPGACLGTGFCDDNSTLQCAYQPFYFRESIRWDEPTCSEIGLTWNGATCVKLFPRFPCKQSHCSGVTTMDKTVDAPNEVFENAECPLVSGHFFSYLSDLSSNSSDPVLRDEASSQLMAANCTTPSGHDVERCEYETLFTVNLLGFLGFAPNCMETVSSSSGTVFQLFPDGAQTVLQNLFTKNIHLLGNSGKNECGPPSDPTAIQCSQVFALAECSAAVVHPTVEVKHATLAEGSICSEIVGSSINSDPELQKQVSLLEAREIAGGDEKCMEERETVNKNLYYVQSIPGLPPLSPKMGANTSVTPQCNECLPKNQYSNTRSPLCFDLDGNPAYNSLDCIDHLVNSTWQRMPKFAPYKCSAAVNEFLCAKSYLKLEEKELCMLPTSSGSCEMNLTLAASENRVALRYALPRFPSNEICNKVQTECEDALSSDSLLRGNCDTWLVNVTTCLNPELEDGVWGCTNPMNGLPQFPKTSQQFAQLSQLPALNVYAQTFDMTSQFVNALSSKTVKPTVSALLYGDQDNSHAMESLAQKYCSCPAPLLVPDNPFGTTISTSTCCALPCLGSMETMQHIDEYGDVQLILSAIGVLMSAYMALTWGIFKETQYIVFWITACSFNVSLAYLISSAVPNTQTSDILCFDNTTPASMRISFDLCTFQGMWVMFWALSECFWWLCQAYDLYLKIVLRRRNTTDYRTGYHIFCWSIPAIVTVVLLSTKSYGYAPNNAYCLLHGELEWWVEWVSFYGFIAGTLILGLGLMFAVFHSMLNQTRQLAQAIPSNSRQQSVKSFGKTFRMYRTSIMFVSLFTFVWSVIFTFRLYIVINTDLYQEQGLSWVRCLFINIQNGIEDPATNPKANTSMLVGPVEEGTVGCGLYQPGGVPQPSLMLAFILVMSQSILIFCVFALNCDGFTPWCTLCESRTKYSREDKTMSRDSDDSVEKPEDFPKSCDFESSTMAATT